MSVLGEQSIEERNFRWAYALLVELAKAELTIENAKTPITLYKWEQLSGAAKLKLMVQARARAGIPEEEFTRVVEGGIYVTDDLWDGERLVSARERHAELMQSNEDYQKEFLLTTFEVGKLLTLVMEVQDRYDTGQIMESLFKPTTSPPQLLAGCVVKKLVATDLDLKHSELRRSINNALLQDSST